MANSLPKWQVVRPIVNRLCRLRPFGKASDSQQLNLRPTEVHSVCMTEWGDWKYLPVNGDLTIGKPVGEPENWSSGVRSVEATIETLLARNLQVFTGLPIQLVRRAYQIDPSADIAATDSVGRVHLFELKKGSFSPQDAAQLNQYLLGNVFADADEYLGAAFSDAQTQRTADWLARCVTGVWANHHGPGTAYKKVRNELGVDNPLFQHDGRPLSKYRWTRLSRASQRRLIHAALTTHASRHGLTVPDLDRIEEVAEKWADDLQKGPLARPVLTAERRLVLWLVGSSISQGALERVRQWRRAGIDARPLRIEARSDGGRWVVRVSREPIPQRDMAERELLEQAASWDKAPTTVKVGFYEERAPSKHQRHGGHPLEQPIVRIKGSS